MDNIHFNKNDYSILNSLIKQECYSPIESLTIAQLSSVTKLSVPKIRLTLKNFLLMELVQQGAKEGISNTFYITQKGINFYNRALGVEVEDLECENGEE